MVRERGDGRSLSEYVKWPDVTSRSEGLTAEDADDGPCALVHEPGLLEALAVLGGRGSGGHLLAVKTTQQRKGNVVLVNTDI